MKSIFLSFFLFLSLFSIKQTLGQVENTNGGKIKGKIRTVVTTNATTVNKPESIKIDAADGFKKAYEKAQKKVKKKQQEENLNNKGIISQAKLSEERFLKAFKKINGMYQYPVIDQDLGSIRTDAESVNIICRDYQYPDGDRVSILINGIPIIVNIVLEQHYQKFNIPLEKGLNKITILALNQGTSGPNTAAFKVYNDSGALLSSNEWNLATGAKATLIIAKDK